LKRLFKILATVLPVLAVVACGPKETQVEESGPEILKISPTSKNSESCMAHDIAFTVTCDGEFSISLEDESWMQLKSTGEGKNGAYTVTFSLQNNEGSETRSQTITATAGKLTATATVSQNALGNVLSSTSVDLVNLIPSSQSWKLPGVWSAKCYETDGTASDWFSISPDTGLQNIATNVEIAAREINVDEKNREGYIEITLGTLTLRVDVVQEPAKINGDTLGVYNFDGANNTALYDELKHQISKRKAASNEFRIVSPSDSKFFVISGLPDSYAVGDSFSANLIQDWVGTLDYANTLQFTVHKTDADKVWLLTDAGMCFVINK